MLVRKCNWCKKEININHYYINFIGNKIFPSGTLYKVDDIDLCQKCYQKLITLFNTEDEKYDSN